MNRGCFVLLLLVCCQVYSQQYVSFEQFGAKGDGSDETAILLKAFAQAKEKKLPIRLSAKKKYRFIPSSNVDITGIPAITGEGVLDCSGTDPKSLQFVFTVRGTKKLLQSSVSGIEKGKTQVLLQKGLELKANDILFITSAEPLPNQRRKYYCKGQRARVRDYNGRTGMLTIDEAFYFDIDKAWIWKNDFQPVISIDSTVHFTTSPMNFIGCIELVYAKGNISGNYENFALAGVSIRSSEAMLENLRSNLPVTHNNGYSIGITVSDMSVATIKNCTMKGGRHTVAGTGGGIWRKSESGGPNEAAGYPASFIVNGGVYQNANNVRDISEDNCAIDSHGNIYKMTVQNCTVYGGLNLGADYALIDNVTIYTDKKRAFNFGSDVQPGSDWGHYQVKNVRIFVDKGNTKPVFYSKSDVEEISFENITMEGVDDNTFIADFRYPPPKNIILDNMNWLRKGLTKSPRFLVHRLTKLQFKRAGIKKEDLKIIQ
jgi:hypothetical protein